nr:hypothetical protein [Tanacetum cinerariifolium]
SGGGVKSSQGVMSVSGDINFDNGLLVTDITKPTTSVVNLEDRAAINNNVGARLLNERDGSYLQGFVTISHRTVTPGTEDLFGNIGLGLNFYSNPGEILVTRNTAQAYSPGPAGNINIDENNLVVTTAATYSYTDTEAGKTGVRYYRLRQVDLDGQYAYSPVRAVSFAGATDAAIASLSSYPSPFTNSDQAALVLQAPTAGTAQLQLTDLMGRTIVNRAVTTVAGISEISVPNASQLAVGTYLVKVTFATGEVKTLRIQKH